MDIPALMCLMLWLVTLNQPNYSSLSRLIYELFLIIQAGYQERVEFIDFDFGHPSLDVFDVMACYSESAKLQFTVKTHL